MQQASIKNAPRDRTATAIIILVLALSGVGNARAVEVDNEPSPDARPASGRETPAPAARKPSKLIIKEFDEDSIFTEEELMMARKRLTRRQLGTELFYAYMFGQKDRINALLTRLYRVAPDSEDYHYYAALREFRTGQRGRAMTFLQKAVKINPRYDPAWNLIGLIYTRADRNEDARKAFEKAVAAAPYEPAYTYNLATALVKQGRPKEALVYTRKSIELKGNSADAFHLQARVLRDLEEHSEALKAFDRAHFYGVRTPDFFMSWLRTAHKAGDYKKALELCARIGHEKSEVLRIHSDIRLKHAEFARAIPLLRALVARPDAKPRDRRRYIFALHKGKANPRAGLRTLKIGAKERRELNEYIRDLSTQRREAPVVRDPILSPPR